MAKRFQVNDHKIAYAFLAAREGEQCIICRRTPQQVKLQIDHMDNNPNNNDPDNLHLVCRTHNLLLRQKTIREHREYIQKYSAVCVSVSEKVRGVGSTHMIKDLVDYNYGSTEMQVNSHCERQFREWLLKVLLKNNFIPKKEAIDSGAEVVGCSQATTLRYLDKMTSAVGNLKESIDPMGIKIITFKR